MPPRTRRKRRSLWRRPAVLLLELLLVGGVLGGGGYGFYAYAHESGNFRVKQIVFEGIERLDENQIASACGITYSSNLLFLDTGGVAARIEALPGVLWCEVERVFPDTVEVRLEERNPVATLMSRNHGMVIDAHQVVLRELSKMEPPVGPLITSVPNLGSIEPGAHLESPELREALEVYHAFMQTQMAKELTVSEIAASDVNDIRMYCNDLSYEIRWGRDDHTTQALRMDLLWKEKGGEIGCGHYLDLRFGKDLACK